MRVVGGVLAGLAIAIGLMIGTNVVLVKITVPSSALFLAATLCGAALYHWISGFVCADIARDNAAARWGLIVLGTAVMWASVVQTWPRMPQWYSAAMMVIAPVALWLGAWVHQRRGQRAQIATAG